MERHPSHYGQDWSTVQEADEEAAYYQEKYGETVGELMQGERPTDSGELPY